MAWPCGCLNINMILCYMFTICKYVFLTFYQEYSLIFTYSENLLSTINIPSKCIHMYSISIHLYTLRCPACIIFGSDKSSRQGVKMFCVCASVCLGHYAQLKSTLQKFKRTLNELPVQNPINIFLCNSRVLYA